MCCCQLDNAQKNRVAPVLRKNVQFADTFPWCFLEKFFYTAREAAVIHPNLFFKLSAINTKDRKNYFRRAFMQKQRLSWWPAGDNGVCDIAVSQNGNDAVRGVKRSIFDVVVKMRIEEGLPGPNDRIGEQVCGAKQYTQPDVLLWEAPGSIAAVRVDSMPGFSQLVP